MSDGLGYTPKVRPAREVSEEARQLSSGIYEVINLRGENGGGGPRTAPCGEKDPDVFYKVKHSWSLGGVPVADMEAAMGRLERELPARNWKILRYGRNNSQARNLELLADSTEKQFTVNIEFLDNSKVTRPNPPQSLIHVSLVSACFQYPPKESAPSPSHSHGGS
ncbi:hypothetical protein [Streptomyces sp. URMC 123]|uniref:hypothetical protein n=1 Tax=Streptomyces sp. URMC 123 TaxID=3423403 RepID=UPI003F1CE84D